MGATKKTEKFPRQILSLDKIKVDHALQSRVATSIEHQRDFSESMLRGDEFPAVTVFWDGKVYWLADGFHRLGAAKQAAKVDPKLRGIRAEIHEGTRRDAMIFSAGANIKFSIPRTSEDKRKAVEMVLSDEDGFTWSATRIAQHVGVSAGTVNRIRVAYCTREGVEIPENVVTEKGLLRPRAIPKPCRDLPFKERIVDSRKYYYTIINRKMIHLGQDEVAAIEKLRHLKKEIEKDLGYFEHPGAWFSVRGISLGGIDWAKDHNLPGLYGHNCVVVELDFHRGESVAKAVGCVLLLREMIKRESENWPRAVLLCYPDDASRRDCDFLDLARQLGVEFLTPDELVASIKGPSDPPAVPCPPHP